MLFESPTFALGYSAEPQANRVISSMFKTELCSLLDCTYPILQAGMGGVARAELVAAVSRAGGYGFLGMVRERPDFVREQIQAVRAGTERPFGVNLIPAATDPGLLQEELAVCFEEKVHSLCFFWDVDPDAVARAKSHGLLVSYQVGSVEDARLAEAAGADMVIAQGVEAGGHVRGATASLVLLPQVAKAVSCPVVASGGFATGASLVAALALGAAGIHCGTAFLATEESFAHAYHKGKVVEAQSGDTVHTDLFAINWPKGAPVRVIANSLTGAMGDHCFGHDPYARAPEPIGEEHGRPVLRFSTDSPLRGMTGDLEAMALFAGQVTGQITDVPSAARRVEQIMLEAKRVLGRLRSLEE